MISQVISDATVQISAVDEHQAAAAYFATVQEVPTNHASKVHSLRISFGIGAHV